MRVLLRSDHREEGMSGIPRSRPRGDSGRGYGIPVFMRMLDLRGVDTVQPVRRGDSRCDVAVEPLERVVRVAIFLDSPVQVLEVVLNEIDPCRGREISYLGVLVSVEDICLSGLIEGGVEESPFHDILDRFHLGDGARLDSWAMVITVVWVRFLASRFPNSTVALPAVAMAAVNLDESNPTILPSRFLMVSNMRVPPTEVKLYKNLIGKVSLTSMRKDYYCCFSRWDVLEPNV